MARNRFFGRNKDVLYESPAEEEQAVNVQEEPAEDAAAQEETDTAEEDEGQQPEEEGEDGQDGRDAEENEEFEEASLEEAPSEPEKKPGLGRKFEDKPRELPNYSASDLSPLSGTADEEPAEADKAAEEEPVEEKPKKVSRKEKKRAEEYVEQKPISYWKWMIILMFTYIPLINVLALIAFFFLGKATKNRTLASFAKARLTCLFISLCFAVMILFAVYTYVISIV